MIWVRDDSLTITSKEPITVDQYTGPDFIGLPLKSVVKLPNGSTYATQFYSLNSACLVGNTEKLAPIFNGKLEPIPFEYDPDTGYFREIPGSWIALKQYESHAWNVLSNTLSQVLDSRVSGDNVRAALNHLRPDLKIKVKWNPDLSIQLFDEKITFYELVQILVQGEIVAFSG